jgi:hypothetical protein
MWRCQKCGETVDRWLDVCWRCGASRDGVEDPNFRSEADDELVAGPEHAKPQPRRLLYALRPLIVFLSLIAFTIALAQGDLGVLLLTTIGVVAANVAGAILGYFVTYALRLPDDGSLTWDSEREEEP